jgi:release factor glutamine methyltransferase
VTLLSQRPNLTAVAVDCDLEALNVARFNANALRVSNRLHLVATNLVDAIQREFPVIVANLPYIPTDTIDDLQPEVARFEPRHALDGGPDGLQLVGDLLEASESILAPDGSLLAEIGDGQAERALELATMRFPDGQVTIEEDTAGLPRFLVVDRAS